MYEYKKSRLRSLALLALALPALALPARALPASAGPATLTVWVSPAGSDSNDGLSAATPFASLQRAGDWLCGGTASCPGRGQPVEVRIAQQVIPVAAQVTWRYYDPSYPTTLEPWSYQPGQGWADLSATGGLPTFDGGGVTAHGLSFIPAGAGSGSTGLRLVYLRWQRFTTSAVELHGQLATRTDPTSGIVTWWPGADAANGVSFYGDYFYQVGNYWHPDRPMGWGAVDAYNSSGDSFTNSHFVQLMNSPADAGHVHALYLSHHSDGTVIQGNEFTDITGDVIRQRDLSEAALVTGNRFTRAGQHGYADDWYCRPDLPDSVCFPKEYRSWRGVFYGNTLGGLYPEGITGTALAWCFDIPGPCPADRWNAS